MTFAAPYAPYDPTDKSCFSYETVIKRWPIIITGIIDHLHNLCHKLAMQANGLGEGETKAYLLKKIEEGTAIIGQISKLKYEMARDKALCRIPDDGGQNVELYNAELEALEKEKKNTWFTAPWLYAECYLYRLLRSFFIQTESWKDVDPFFEQKMLTFKQSRQSILQIATTMHELEVDHEAIRSDPKKLRILFNEMIQMCLWGNATDLSLLTHLSQADIHNLQAVGKEARTARQKFILKDDEEAVWAHIQTLKDSRVDIVLDNSGFELFTDLVFADFLVTYTPYVSKVVFHPKLIPWFVSDVTPPDFKATFAALADDAFFAADEYSGIEPMQREGLHAMAARWASYLSQGVFQLAVGGDTPLGGSPGMETENTEFWTTAKPYWSMLEEAPGTFGALQRSGLVVFKGDLNYRKLTGDIRWPAWTPFAEALGMTPPSFMMNMFNPRRNLIMLSPTGPLAGAFPLLSLRTNKADVVVGVPREVAEELDRSGERWRVDGQYALVSFLPQYRD